MDEPFVGLDPKAVYDMKELMKQMTKEGKTVIPFCTSSSSGMGQSGKNLEMMEIAKKLGKKVIYYTDYINNDFNI